MNTKTLFYFKTVANLKHFTKAADMLYITQSALSKSICCLEAELEVTLFKKQGRNVVLTRAGEQLYLHVTRALDEIDAGVAEAKHMEEIERHTVFVSAIFSLYAAHLPEKILTFRHQYPDCRFSIEYKYTSAILRDVINKHCELGICGYFPEDRDFAELEKHLLYREPAEIVVGKNHRFAGRDLVNVEELKDEPFVIWNRSQLGTNHVIIELCRNHGFEPNISVEAYNDLGVLSTVAMGEGIALVPTERITGFSEVVPIHLKLDTPLTRDIYIAWRKKQDLSSTAAKFRNLLISTAITD